MGSSMLPSACLLRPRAVSFSVAAAATTTTPSMIMLAWSSSPSPLSPSSPCSPAALFLGRRNASPHQQQQVRHAAEVLRPRKPYVFTQLVQLSDGSTFTVRTTMPTAYYRSDRDSRNHLLWQPSDRTLSSIEMDEAGKLASFRSRFGRGWDQQQQQQNPLSLQQQQQQAASEEGGATILTPRIEEGAEAGAGAGAGAGAKAPITTAAVAAAAAAEAEAAEAKATQAEEAAAEAQKSVEKESGQKKTKTKKEEAREAKGAKKAAAAASLKKKEPVGGDPFDSLVNMIGMYSKQDEKSMRGLTVRESKKKTAKK